MILTNQPGGTASFTWTPPQALPSKCKIVLLGYSIENTSTSPKELLWLVKLAELSTNLNESCPYLHQSAGYSYLALPVVPGTNTFQFYQTAPVLIKSLDRVTSSVTVTVTDQATGSAASVGKFYLFLDVIPA